MANYSSSSHVQYCVQLSTSLIEIHSCMFFLDILLQMQLAFLFFISTKKSCQDWEVEKIIFSANIHVSWWLPKKFNVI